MDHALQSMKHSRDLAGSRLVVIGCVSHCSGLTLHCRLYTETTRTNAAQDLLPEQLHDLNENPVHEGSFSKPNKPHAGKTTKASKASKARLPGTVHHHVGQAEDLGELGEPVEVQARGPR